MGSSRAHTAASRRRRGVNRSSAEALEPRTLLAFAPAGPEFRANTATAANQGAPALAADADGDFIIAWQSDGQDGSSYGVYAQRYSAAGAAQGAEFRVNTTTDDTQAFPAVAADADGDFVVAWQSYGQDGGGYGIYARRFNATGVAQGAEFRVNQTTDESQTFPSVAMDAAGNFVVAWESYAQDGDGLGVYARRYDAAGVAQGGESRVNGTTAGDQFESTVAADADGDFVVAWTSSGQDGSGNGVYARRFNAAGAAQGAEFRVNTATADDQSNPAVAVDPAGDFVVAWQSYGQDGDKSGVYARRFSAAGSALGTEFRANSTTANSQANPAVAVDGNGGFVITWESRDQDGSGYGVYAQRYSAAGATQGGEFRVNTTTAGAQGAPAVAVDAAGDTVVAWESIGQDGSGYGVYAQRYTAAANLAPVATLGPAGPSVGGDVIPGAAYYWFKVIYTDDVAVDYHTIGAGDVLVTGPGGYSQPGALSNLTLAGATWTATYHVPAPGGTWNATDNGTYTISLRAGEVADNAGLFVPAATLTTLVVNVPDAAPTSTLQPTPDLTVPGGAYQWFKVTYADDVAINYVTIGTGDVLVTGPGGYSQAGTLSNLTVSPDGKWTTTYRVPAPGGVWDAADNGNYVVSLRAGEVSDTSGKSVPASILGQFVVSFIDPTPPAAALSVANVVTAGGTNLWFTVAYSDNVGVAYQTIDGNDVQITGPGGYLQAGALSNLTVSAGVWNATYRIVPPGGSWGAEDNGTYTVSMKSNQVADTFGNFVPAGALGTFQVSVPAPSGAPAAAADSSASSVPFSEVAVPLRRARTTRTRFEVPELLR